MRLLGFRRGQEDVGCRRRRQHASVQIGAAGVVDDQADAAVQAGAHTRMQAGTNAAGSSGRHDAITAGDIGGDCHVRGGCDVASLLFGSDASPVHLAGADQSRTGTESPAAGSRQSDEFPKGCPCHHAGATGRRPSATLVRNG